MLLGTQLPAWEQIIGRKKAGREKFFNETEHTLFLAESCMSINLIANACKRIKGRDKIYIWVPDYFCNQTIYSFRENWMEINYYPIDRNMDPKWCLIREKAKNCQLDIFIFTHYFGKYHASISNAKEICASGGGILIEDCAHLLYASGKAGRLGDFVIFSPHKQLPIFDGAILQCNRNDLNTDICDEVLKSYGGLEREKDKSSWYIKKGIQKVVPVHRTLTYYPGVHMGEDIKEFHTPAKISRASYNILCGYTYEEFKRIAYIRRVNLAMMNFIMEKLFPDLVPLMDETTDVPYLAVYSLENCADKKAVTDELLKRDYTVLYWPDLPFGLEGIERHRDAFKLSENIITLPIHQGITPQKLIKKFYGNCKEESSNNIMIDTTAVTRGRWDILFAQYRMTNIPQEWDYGNAKEETEGWKLTRGIVTKGGQDIGTIQILEKKAVGITVAVRVNRGPLLIEEYDNCRTHLLIMKLVRKMYKICIPIFWAPYLEMCPGNLKMVSDYGWKCRDFFGFPSATVNLSLPEDVLHKNLKPNWRKNLNKAKKDVYLRFNEYDVEEMINLYIKFLTDKDIPGIPRHILKYLFNMETPPLEVLTAHNDKGKIIAYKVLYLHGNTATSFIAWNTEEGLRKNARTLLIYESMLWLKRNGFAYFDLGGVDDINTEAVAKYKRGMGGEDYQLLGEFISI